MRITRSISIDMETWERANSHAREHGLSFSGLVEKSLIHEMQNPGVDALLATAFGPETVNIPASPLQPTFTRDIAPVIRPSEETIGRSRPAPKPGAKK